MAETEPVTSEEKLGEGEKEIEEKIELSPPIHPIFPGDTQASKARARPGKEKTVFRKRGRKLTVAKVRNLFVLYRIPRGQWPEDLDYEMCLYYTIHYIREDGKFHDIFLQWKAEAETLHGKRFRVSKAIRPKSAQPRSKVLHFPKFRAASEG